MVYHPLIEICECAIGQGEGFSFCRVLALLVAELGKPLTVGGPRDFRQLDLSRPRIRCPYLLM